MEEEIKRLFFGVEVYAPWPERLPHGRLLDAAHRHMTLAFLGNIPYLPLLEQLKEFPDPLLRIGVVGKFDRSLLLPVRHPHVVAWQGSWYDGSQALSSFQKTLTDWLAQLNYPVDRRDWLPHVTLCRSPFDGRAWQKTFMPLPFFTQSIHLYESVGKLVYVPIWTYPIQVPFEELDHTADIAFNVYGKSLLELYHHAFTALAFKFPALLRYFIDRPVLETIDDVVIVLNDVVGRADRDLGCPFKAISFHGDVLIHSDNTLQWEMIVDV